MDAESREVDLPPNQVPPFTQQLLRYAANADGSPLSDAEQLQSTLPACYRGRESGLFESGLLKPSLEDGSFLDEELDLQRLTCVLRWIFTVGLPLPPAPLHHQINVLNRRICLLYRMDMHLIWSKGQIFVKPMPRFLLDPRFWKQHLSCRGSHSRADTTQAGGGHLEGELKRQKHRQVALGFMVSYAGLIPTEYDFMIAKEHYLMPQDVEWSDWRVAIGQVLSICDLNQQIHRRFIYGELWLNRLNWIYILTGQTLYGYKLSDMGGWLHGYFALLAAATVYMAIVLTAMQVGLATTYLAENDAFQYASYWFAVFSILGPLIAVGLVGGSYVVFYGITYLLGFVEIHRYNRARLGMMGVETPDLSVL